MREKIKNYVTGIWGVEILTLAILVVTLVTGYYNAFNDSAAKVGAGTFDALFNKEKYIESMIYLIVRRYQSIYTTIVII